MSDKVTGRRFFSVIMPTYNSARFVNEAIESVLAQSWGDFELLISDNGSVDGTWAVLESWARRDPRIDLLRCAAKKSPGANRNHAIEHASGQWLTFLDSDDRWSGDRLEVHVEALGAAPDMVLCFADYRRFSKTPEDAGPRVQADVTGFFQSTAEYVQRVEPLPSGADLFHLDPRSVKLLSCLVHCPISTNVTTVHRETMLKAGVQFHEDWMINEDFHAWMQLLDLGQVAAVNRPLAFYRVNEASLTTDEVRYYAGMAQSHEHWRKRIWETLSPKQKRGYRRKVREFYESVAWLMSEHGELSQTWSNAMRGLQVEVTMGGAQRAARMIAKAALLRHRQNSREAT